jgi:hypothetical protein
MFITKAARHESNPHNTRINPIFTELTAIATPNLPVLEI